MSRLLKYAGCYYRLAQELPDDQQPIVVDATKFLQGHGITNIEFGKYYDSPEGAQVAFTTNNWGNANAIIVLDFKGKEGKKSTLQSMTVSFCGNALEASGAVELEGLIKALATLNRLRPKPGRSSFQHLEDIADQELRKDAIFDWLLYGDKIGIAIADIGHAYEQEKSKFEFDYTKLTHVLKGIDKLLQTKEGQEQQRAYTEIKAALHELTNQDWKDLIAFRERMKAPFVPSKQLVLDYVHRLTAHEDYQGDVTMLPEVGNIVYAAVGIAPPIEALVFQFERVPGASKLTLHGMELMLCGVPLIAETNDEVLAKDVVSAAVDIMLASEQAAAPEATQTRRQDKEKKKRPEPKKEGQELSKEEQQKIINYVVEGPGIWYGDKDFSIHDDGKVIARYDKIDEAKQAMTAFLKAHEDEPYYYVVNPRQESATAFTRQGDEVLTFPFRFKK
jgi:hypothetical protein